MACKIQTKDVKVVVAADVSVATGSLLGTDSDRQLSNSSERDNYIGGGNLSAFNLSLSRTHFNCATDLLEFWQKIVKV